MCLIIHKPASLVLTRELADDVYSRNHDGFGVIFFDPTDNSVNTVKTLGNRDAIWEIIEAHNDKELLMHWRMKTHGDIDFENCHPYELIPQGDGALPSYMMHNGVLSTGNSRDTSKSDTWHYIRNFLRPMLKNNEQFLHNPAFNALIGEHIGGNNKFAIMDATGQVNIINRKSGVEHAGLWFSNTYAWSASKFGHTYNTGYQGGKSNVWQNTYHGGANNRGSLFGDDEDYAEYWNSKSKQQGKPTVSVTKADKKPEAKVEPTAKADKVEPDLKFDIATGSVKHNKLHLNISEAKTDPSLRNFNISTNKMLVLEAAYQEALLAIDDRGGNSGLTRAMVHTYIQRNGEDEMTLLLDETWAGEYTLYGFLNVLRSYTKPSEEADAKRSA